MKFEKGKAIPLNAIEKITLAVKQAVKAKDWEDKCAWVKSLSVESSNVTPLDGGKERISAVGNLTAGFRCLKKDAILNSRDFHFDISFRDSKDEWSLPDVYVDECVIEPME